MKKLILPIASLMIMISLVLISCGQESSTEYTVKQTFFSKYLKEYKTNLGHVIHDSIGRGFANERVDITDKEGRPLVVASRPSESYLFTFVKYLYDENGEIHGFIRFPFNGVEQNNYDAVAGDEAYDEQFNILNNDDSLYFLKDLLDLVLTKGNDEPYFERFYFKRDSLGRIIKVFDPILNKSITADIDWHIEYEIEEDTYFWSSDILGSLAWLSFTFKPNLPDEEKKDHRKYYGYIDIRDMNDTKYWYLDGEGFEEMIKQR